MKVTPHLQELIQIGRIKERFNLSPYLTLKTHVIARYYMEAKTREDLLLAKQVSMQSNIPLLIIGGGSNVAVLHSELNSLVVHNRYSKFEVLSETDTDATLLISSGYPMALLVRKTVESGLEGFENHLGLPGTVGGGIYMNSKWTNPYSYVGDSLLYAYLIGNDGREKKVDREYFQFAYDYSILHNTHEIILEGVFQLKKVDPAHLKKRSQEALKYRHETQPHGVFSSGCFFQNISQEDQKKYALPTTSAGYLIDKAGLKGAKEGNYYVSSKHANFILNNGEGKAEDLMRLIKHIKQTVLEKFGIELKEEVIIL